MRHFRSIILIFAVLLQALPGVVGPRVMGMTTASEAKPQCEMDCCAWIHEMEMQEQQKLGENVKEKDSCACSPASEEQERPANPASIPSRSSRDVIPLVYWKAQEVPFQPAAPIGGPQSAFALTDAPELATPHVRLPVLFCAILI